MEAFMVASIPSLYLVGFSCLFGAIFVGFSCTASSFDFEVFGLEIVGGNHG
jgi:hypothetical protein